MRQGICGLAVIHHVSAWLKISAGTETDPIIIADDAGIQSGAHRSRMRTAPARFGA
jgi:hypothetical protein